MMRIIVLILALAWLSLADRTAAQEKEQLEIGGGRIAVNFSSAMAEPLRKLVLDWVASSARAVTAYYDRFPVSHSEIRVRFFDGHGGAGRPDGRMGWRIDLDRGWARQHGVRFCRGLGVDPRDGALRVPVRAREHHWIEEGSATYVEGIARARAGDLTPEKVWRDLIEGLPKGLPQGGDRGLDFTPTWGRIYWGGALFCLLADIEIRKRTGNKKGLDDASRAILKAGGTIESEWPLLRAFETGDRATGVPVLRELYEKMRAAPAPVDLSALWKELGVERRNGRIEFNDRAPLAPIRKAITQPAR